ncbi:MAG TPA: hypothetical protein VGG44_03305 [Tepidisphaeraceae bacterium]
MSAESFTAAIHSGRIKRLQNLYQDCVAAIQIAGNHHRSRSPLLQAIIPLTTHIHHAAATRKMPLSAAAPRVSRPILPAAQAPSDQEMSKSAQGPPRRG